jgi:shikimate 5-dehydrogenase
MIIYTLRDDEEDIDGVDLIELRSDRTHLIKHHKPYILTKNAPQAGADYVDVEYPQDFSQITQEFRNVKVIYSHHGPYLSKEKTFELIDQMFAKNPDIVKCCFDHIALDDYLDLLGLFRKYPKRLVMFAQGELGQATRFISYQLGARWIYTSKDGFCGQIPLNELLQVYHIRRLRETTQIFGLVKGPSSPPSVGYKLYNRFFYEQGIDAFYCNLIIEDRSVEKVLRSNFFSGLSVTMPYKEQACKYVDQKDPFVASCGSLNTVKNKKGYNTDCEILKRIQFKGKKVAIMGGGGVAKAYVEYLKSQSEVTVFVRNVKKVATELSVQVLPIPKFLSGYDYLIDTLPVTHVLNDFDRAMHVIDVKLFFDQRYQNSNAFISGKDVFLAQGEKQMSIFLDQSVDLSTYYDTFDAMLSS